MKGVLELQHNGSKWAGEKPDPIEMLITRMRTYKLDPERNWITTDKRANRRHYGGNFLELSAGYGVWVKIDSPADKALASARRVNRKL